jgi:hypothetical protein
MEPSGRISNRSTIPSLITCVCSGLLIVGLLLLCACGQHPSGTLADTTTASVATAPTPEVPFEQQVQDVLDTKDMQWITPFWRANCLRIEKADPEGHFVRRATRIAREQAVWALDAMEVTAQNDSNDCELARNAWKTWQDARAGIYFHDGPILLPDEPLTEEEEARLLRPFDDVFAHSLATQARAIDPHTQRVSIADLSGNLGALRFPHMHGGFNGWLPRPNGIGVVKVLYDERLLPRPDLLQLLRIGVRDESLAGDCAETALTRIDPNDRSLLALLQLEIPLSADGPAVRSDFTMEGRIWVGAVGFKALADAFALSDTELIALGVTEEEAHFILHNARIAKAATDWRS